MICVNWISFRRLFAVHALTGAIPCTFLTTSPPRITRTDAGSFVADGFELGMIADIANTVSNNTRVHVEAFETNGSPNDTIVCAADDVLAAEVAATAEIDGAFIDGDGVWTWPIDLVRKVGSGFGDAGSTLTGVTPWYDPGGSLEISCNTGAPDAVFGVDDFDWYLSQRTDEQARQYLEIENFPADGGESFSGFVRIRNAALADTFAPNAPSITPQVLKRLFRYAHLYVRRRSDGAIQWVDLHREMTRQ